MNQISLLLPDDYKNEVQDFLEKQFRISDLCEKTEFIITDISYVIDGRIKVTPKTFVISNLSDEENVKLIHQYKIHHLIGRNPEIYLNEIADNLKKITTQQIWGVRHYFGEDLQERNISFSDSFNIHEKITEELSHFQFDGYFSSPTDYLRLMANELLSNSLYKGPNKKRLEKGLDSHDRKSPVFLKGAELVQATLGANEKGVALSVQDSFGELTHDLLIQNLVRSFVEKTPLDKKDGAGLGLYLTYLHSNQLIVNLKKNYRTEVICIIDKNKRFLNYKNRIRSFHFFEEVISEKTHD